MAIERLQQALWGYREASQDPGLHATDLYTLPEEGGSSLRAAN